MLVEIGKIIPNRYRNFKHYPIEPEQVQTLKESFERLDQWDALPARPVGDKYELACGHHRLEAMRELGYYSVELNVRKRTDDDMVQIMITENATQRGRSSAALFDSVSAITERLAYELLRWDTYEDWVANTELVGKIFPTKRHFGETLKKLNKSGLGHTIIRRYAGEKVMTEGDCRTGIEAMKQSNALNEIMAKVTAVVEAEKEIEFAERQRQRDEEARKRKAAEAKAEAEAKAKAEREAAAAKNAADRKKRAAQAEADRKKRAEAKAKADAEAKAMREAEEERLAAARKAKREALEKAQAEREKKVDLSAIKMFKNNLHVRAFIGAMSTETALKTFAPNMHVAVAKQISDNAAALKREMSAEFIKHQISVFLRDGKLFQAQSVEQVKQERYKRDIRNKLGDIESDIQKYTGLLSHSIQEYQTFLKEHPELKTEMNVNGIRFKFELLAKNIKQVDAALMTEIGSWMQTSTQNL